MLADFIYACRWLRRAPGFTLAAIVSLALGIGANLAIFSLVDAVLLRSLPVQRPNELVLFSTRIAGGDPAYQFSYNTFLTFRREARTLVDTAASAPLRINVDAAAVRGATVTGQLVSGNYYALLGVPMVIGRPIVGEDAARPGDGNVAVLSYGFWRRQFGGDPQVIGSAVRLNGYPFTIVGVSSPEFFGTRPGEVADVTVPLSMQLQVSADAANSLLIGVGADDFWLDLIGRRQSGVAMAVAEAEADGIFQRILPDILKTMGPKAGALMGARLSLESGSQGLSQLKRRFSRPLLVLMGASALVLLIACANVANLLLARASARRHEMAIRVSLGATRARLIRQLVTESLLLAGSGALVGLVVVWWSTDLLSAFLVGANVTRLAASMDVRVLSFTIAVTLLTGLLFGVIPALGISRTGSYEGLKAGVRSTAGGRWFGARGWLVAAQVAVSLVLLVGATLFVRTLVNLRAVDLGFEREHVLSLRLEPHGSNQKRPNEARLRQMYGGLLDRVRAIPGVRSVSLSGTTPLGNETPLAAQVVIPGYVQRGAEDMKTRIIQIYPGYFATLGIPILAGRDLDAADDSSRAAKVAVINETMARRFYGAPQAAIGRQFDTNNRMTFQIVGVVGDVHDRTLREPIGPMAYATYAHAPTGRGQMTLLVRYEGSASAIVPAIRDYARAMDPAMPLLDVEVLSSRVDAATQQERLAASLSALFGVLALFLAAVGLYGVMTYAVARRQAEFGVRLALGASPRVLGTMILSETLLVVGTGIIAGLAAAILCARLVTHMLFGLPALDPLSFAIACVTLLVVGAAVAYLPARRASRVDPLVILRAE